MLTRTSVRRASQRGFTLLEVSISVAILVGLIAATYQAIIFSMQGRERAQRMLRTPKVANAILDQIMSDFRYAVLPPLTGDAGFHGQSRQKNGEDADRVDFLSARRTRTVGLEDDGTQRDDDPISALSEVGWACRPADDDPTGKYIELWRREDYYVDSDPTKGGQYTLVYNKIRRFSLRYFPPPEQIGGENNSEGLDEWDSRIRKSLPYAIILELWFDSFAEEDGDIDDVEPHKITRVILLRGGATDSIQWSAGNNATSGTQPGG